MSKEVKDSRESKHRPEALRQPLRKDSLSSVFSWAGLQAKSSIPKTSAASTTSPQSTTQQSSPGNDAPKSRRHSHGHSHSQSLDIQKKTTSATTDSKDSKVQDGNATIKTSKAAASPDKSNKPAQDAPQVRKEASQHPLQETAQDTKSSSPPERPTSPMPKSILRVSSPDGQRPARHIISFPAPSPPTDSLDQQLNSPELPPLSPLLSPVSPFQPAFPDLTTSPSSPALESPPNSPILRPMSPGATVRFAKATIHRVEVGPGRRFIPVKRKSKSTITYIAPLDPGTQKPAPQKLLGSPTKLRRHQENQAAMGRYWLRTEEEEAQWRAEAAQKAAEEAARYRAEPPRVGGGDVKPPEDGAQGAKVEPWPLEGARLEPVDDELELDKLEEEISEGEEDGDGEGAAVGVSETSETATLPEASEAEEVKPADEEYPDPEPESEKKQEVADDKQPKPEDEKEERAATPTSLLLEKPKADTSQPTPTTTASVKPEAPITPRLGANIQAHGGSGGGGGGGERREAKANHLHLSGRRNRRTLMFDEPKQEITA
ncbi:hypothetical protein B0T19DRAFT_187724 [Cercophora scortea]|uniref:Uncharacterized protein n=1 Tax=Cercophora scortea TaxID=314031 RepID=A0AAE0MD98_9PEZI|nr:hypothetical protein B0T19DRAFT_187724 [Cercophora scortea]